MSRLRSYYIHHYFKLYQDTMKKILLSIIMSIFLFHGLLAKEKKVASKIDKVTVFIRGAQVTRTTSAQIPAGNSTLIFKELPYQFDQQSFQLNGKGAFTILSIEHQKHTEGGEVPTDKIKALEDKIIPLKRQIQEKKELDMVFVEEKKMILKNNSFGGAAEGVKVSELTAAADFYRNRLNDILKNRLALKKEIRLLEEEINKHQTAINELRKVDRKDYSEVKVNLFAKSAVIGKFTMLYIVKNAGWLPSYDLRVKDVKTAINLTYKANFFQQTGEDWENVSLTLSTGASNTSKTIPMLQPWLIRREANYRPKPKRSDYTTSYNYGGERTVTGVVTDAQTGDPLPGVTVVVKGTTRGAVTDVNGRYSIRVSGDVLVYSYVGFENEEITVGNRSSINVRLQEDSSALEEVVVTGYGGGKVKKDPNKKKEAPKDTRPIVARQQVKETKVEFKVDFKYSIASDGKKRMVALTEHTLPASYQYVVIPKLNSDAFLTAKVSGWEKHQLLAGEANLFFEGTFLGKTVLNTYSTNDTLTVSLGTDENIIVTRENEKEYNSKKALASNQKTEEAWVISVRNNKRSDITILIEDQIPVSTIDDVKVEFKNPDNATVDEPTGKLSWTLKVPKGKTKSVKFRYELKFPKSANISLD